MLREVAAVWDPLWVEGFRGRHGGREPTEQDWQDHLLSQRYPGTGPGGAWNSGDWMVYEQMLGLLGAGLLGQIGRRGGLGAAFYTGVGVVLSLGRLQPGPDATRLAFSQEFPRGAIPPNTGGWTWGNVIIIPSEQEHNLSLLVHEYTHVLQYRLKGIRYAPSYALRGLYNWARNPYEIQAVQVEGLYKVDPWLPPPWEIHWVGGESG